MQANSEVIFFILNMLKHYTWDSGVRARQYWFIENALIFFFIPTESTCMQQQAGHIGTDEITALEILKYLFQNEKENEIQHVPNMRLCMVCHLEDPNILFLPCCHICCCQSCGESCYLCSYCHCHIKAKKKIYIS